MSIETIIITTNPGDDWEIGDVDLTDPDNPLFDLQIAAGGAPAEGVHEIGVKLVLAGNGYTSPEFTVTVPVLPALAFPVTEFTGGRQGAVYDVSKASTLWRDVDGTEPAELNDIVRRIDDLSGRGHHLFADSDAQAPLWKQDGSGFDRLEFTATQFMHSAAGGYTMGPPPHWMLLACTRSVTTSQTLLVAGSSGTKYHRIFANSSQRATGSLRNSPTLAETQASTPGSGEFPTATPKVVGSLAIASQNDVTVNGAAPATIPNSWTTESLAGGRIGLNTDNTGAAASGAAMTFYGGLLYHGNPGSGGGSVRAQGVTWAGALIGLSL